MRAYNVGLVLSSPTRTKSPDLSELLPSLIISRAFPPISSTVLPVPYAKKYTSVIRAADWVMVCATTLGMLRLTIKTLLNQSRDISASRTILTNRWRFVAFPSIYVILKAVKTQNKNLSSKLAPLVPVESKSVFHSSNLATLFYCLFLLIT